MRALTKKQQAFVGEYRQSFNATDAYRKAYGCSDATANVEGPKSLVKPSIQKALSHHQAITAKKFNTSIEKYQARLYDKAYMDPMELFDESPDGDLKFKPLSKMTPKARQMIRGVTHTTIEAPNGNTITTTRYIFKDAMKAEELFGRSIGAFQKDSTGNKIMNLQVNFYGKHNPRPSGV